MISYKLLTASDAAGLAVLVNQSLADGYSLHGSTGAIVGVSGGHTYFQAVAK